MAVLRKVVPAVTEDDEDELKESTSEEEAPADQGAPSDNRLRRGRRIVDSSDEDLNSNNNLADNHRSTAVAASGPSIKGSASGKRRRSSRS
eukprot:2648081-Pleurochrysis_carterae.AAC.1